MPQPLRQAGSLSDRVYEDLASRIRTCSLKPGRMLFEAELAKHYAVSKTPVREALHRLIEEGVIEKYARAGYVVKPIGVQDVLAGYHVRALLEGEAAALAAANILDSELVQLGSMLSREMKAQPYVDSNRDFHLTIAAASRNERLAKLVRITYDDLLRVTLLDPYLSQWTEEGCGEHERMYEALCARDPEAARAAARAHIEAGLQRVLSGFQARQRLSTAMP